MKVKEITYEDLMKECNRSDPIEFRKILRRNNLPLVSSRKPIPRNTANEIVETLTGYSIDWYKYKIELRDKETGGPLIRSKLPESKKIIDHWFKKVDMNRYAESELKESILGIVCSGGFLEGSEGTEFTVSFDQGINVIIGDRGSGKSTVANLLGLMSDSVGAETEELVKILIGILDPKSEDSDEIANYSRRALQILRGYNIVKYSIFYVLGRTIYCNYIDLEQMVYDVFILQKGEWVSTESYEFAKPSILFFEQGEVTRIAEDREHKYYLNNILDAIYPDLYKKRESLTRGSNSLVTQFEYFKPNHEFMKSGHIINFIRARSKELRVITSEIKDGYFSEQSSRVLQGYVDRYYGYINLQMDDTWKQRPIRELLTEGEDELYFLFVSRIIGFLSSKLNEIKHMRNVKIDLINGIPNSKQSPEFSDLTTQTTDKNQRNDDETSPDAEMANEDIVDDEYLEELGDIEDLYGFDEITELNGEENFETEDSPEGKQDKEDQKTIREKGLFLSSEEIEESIPADEELLANANQIIEFLYTRLRILRGWVDIYTSRRYVWNESLESLATNYINVINNRVNLINLQEIKCQNITKAINQDDFETNIYTIDADKSISEHKDMIGNLKNLGYVYEEIISASPQKQLRELVNIASAYDETSRRLLREFNYLRNEKLTNQHEFLFNQIGIELLQGNTYRDFNLLSFGQKSGIILKMVLSTSDKHVIIIDQPEDNLDVYSIVNMLAQTINRLGETKQIILVTHNSNLVMGMAPIHAIVLESMGGNGRLKTVGSSLDRNVVKEMIEVLEGGPDTFERKIKIYEDFIRLVRGLIQDIDIMMIESSFRRKTIDELRNYLQPIVSDRSILDFLRHELKQRDPTNIQVEIQDIQQQTTTIETARKEEFSSFQNRLINLLNNLSNHITRFREAVDEIRLLDTQPRSDKIDLYQLLTEIKEEYCSKISKERDIHIDIDTKLDGEFVIADGNHLRLVFHNLLNNSLRATESKITSAWMEGNREDISEQIQIDLANKTDTVIQLTYRDNGIGIPIEIKDKLYVERCSTQKGKDHGLGGVIIRKLLDLNHGSIKVEFSNQSEGSSETIQRIILHRENGF